MSSPFTSNPSTEASAQLPRGEVLGRYTSYLDAQKVVDYLADNDFPVTNVSIVGNDLKMVERVTGKLSYPKVAMAGAAQGAMFGVFVGLLLSLFTPSGGLAQILSSVGLGMAIWMLVGVLGYSFRRGRRDFASSNQVMAGYYDVVVAFEHAAKARQVASKLPMGPNQAQHVSPAWAPPQEPQAPAAGAAQGHGHGQGQGAGAGDGGEKAGADGDATRRSGYEDLPDGRPQFGLRIGQDQPSGGRHAAGAPEGGPGERPEGERGDEPEGQPREDPRDAHGPHATSGDPDADDGGRRDA